MAVLFVGKRGADVAAIKTLLNWYSIADPVAGKVSGLVTIGLVT
jgi:hypothetical protein